MHLRPLPRPSHPQLFSAHRCLCPRRYLATESSLPPTAPKANPGVKRIISSPDLYTTNCLNRNYPALSKAPQHIVTLHDELIALQRSIRGDRERHNTLSGRLKAAVPASPEPGDPTSKEALIAEAKELKKKIAATATLEEKLNEEMHSLALSLPNLTHPSAPVGSEPRVLEYLNPHLAPTEDGKPGVSHTEIGKDLALLEFSAAGAVSGWGWYYLLNEAVLLEQALINYALSLAVQHGFTLCTPPNIVYSHIASACGFRPRDQGGEQQIYVLDGGKHSLAGTAEIPLAGFYVNHTFAHDELPVKMCGVGRAYRAEAGARGVESKGLYRVHEFTKVELFAWTPPDDVGTVIDDAPLSASSEQSTPVSIDANSSASSVFDSMLAFQKTLLTSLGLHARVLEMPTADLGASAARKIDIEAYMPSRAGRDPWGEVSSLSLCTDYQSRRLATRFKTRGANGTTFPWTLNGTAVAVPRVLLAILENGWEVGEESGGRVKVPEVLRKWMGGMEWISGKGRM